MKPAAIQTLRDFETKPDLFSKKNGELKLSGSDLVEMLRAVLDKGASLRFRAKGFSMSPFIKDNDIITVSPLTDVSIRSGDVAAFIHPEMKKLVIHRVVGKKGECFHIKGDNIPDTDEVIPVTNIMGRVTRVERNGKVISFGLGPERFLIAFLTRIGLLSHLLTPMWKLVRPFVKRMAP
jgi:signal peptidase I